MNDDPGLQELDELAALLDASEAALARLDDGTYEQCERCGGVIGDEILAANPTRSICSSCEGPQALA